MSPGGRRPRVLLVGGGTGLVGRALVEELRRDHALRSVHRHPAPEEVARGVEFRAGDIAADPAWPELLEGVDAVVNVAWYRQAPERTFRSLTEGLERLLAASVDAGVERFVHLSVPPAPPALEASLPYLTYKRRFDHALRTSGLSYAILRPTALFGRGDRLLGVMVRTIHRAPFFPMFGDGRYHLSPISVRDLARIVRGALGQSDRTVRDLGGPVRYSYRELTDRIFRALGKRPRYWRLGPAGSRRLAWCLEGIGSSLLYLYEVEWLMSDLLGLPSADDLAPGLARVEPYLDSEARRWRPTA